MTRISTVAGTLLFVVSTSMIFGQQGPASRPANPPQRSVVGTPLKIHELKFGDKQRIVRVWLPPGYDASGDARYPVLYMHDGQNCMDVATGEGGEWGVDEAITKLAAAKKIEAPIVVAIDHGGSDRIAELTFLPDPRMGGGQAAPYAAFFLDTVKPFIDANYRTRPGKQDTLMGGSSLGALVSIEIARRNPTVIGRVMAMSPSLWWARENLTQEVAKDPAPLRDVTIWLDIGRREGEPGPGRAAIVAMTQRFDTVLTATGIRHRLVIDDTGGHNVMAWSSRLPAALEYLLPPKN